jgi:hypothetical protein
MLMRPALNRKGQDAHQNLLGRRQRLRSLGPKSERNVPLTTAIHEAMVCLGKNAAAGTFATVDVQRRGDAGRRSGELEPDFANGLLRTIAGTKANVLHGQ